MGQTLVIQMPLCIKGGRQIGGCYIYEKKALMIRAATCLLRYLAQIFEIGVMHTK